MKYEKNFEIWSFIYVNDILFADNMLNCKSFQSYIMLLFEELITWKINKQDTVTILSMKAELLTLSQTVKKAIFISYLLKVLMLMIDKSLIIEYNNKQTLRLVTKNFMKLSTKLWHVNIHNHWLWQEHSQQKVQFSWISMWDMIADDLTKALSHQQHEQFLRQIRLKDISECLWQNVTVRWTLPLQLRQKGYALWSGSRITTFQRPI